MFRCKHFTVDDSRCAMKVSTDALILGSWAQLESPKRIVDIGCGSGILSLMMLQKSPSDCEVIAVDIDERSAEQCRSNLAQSPWSQRAQVVCADIMHWDSPPFDVIICNPPYFAESQSRVNATMSLTRRVARHQGGLTCEVLFATVKRLCTPELQFWVMYPYQIHHTVLENAAAAGFYCHKLQHVRHDREQSPYLTLFQFSLSPVLHRIDPQDLVIKDAHDYTSEFKNLCKDFYLRF